MQEQVNEKSVTLIVKGTKITGRMLEKAILAMLRDSKKQRGGKQPKTYRGKQSVKHLVGQGAGVSNIEITDKNIKSFDRVARKYGVDYSLKKDASNDPPRWLVFFKSRDADVLTAAFNEYTAKSVKRVDKPSIIAAVRKNLETVKSAVLDKVKNKDKGLEI